MTTNFLDALKNRAAKIETSLKPAPAAQLARLEPTVTRLPDGSYMPNHTQIDIAMDTAKIQRVERVVNKNRLDIYFTQAPNQVTRNNFKSMGWRYSPDRVCWYHQDNKQNCDWLAERYNVQGLDTVDKFKTEPEIVEPEFTPEYATFRVQVDELLAYTKICPADLMLKAIDCLHKKTFSQN